MFGLQQLCLDSATEKLLGRRVEKPTVGALRRLAFWALLAFFNQAEFGA